MAKIIHSVLLPGWSHPIKRTSEHRYTHFTYAIVNRQDDPKDWPVGAVLEKAWSSNAANAAKAAQKIAAEFRKAKIPVNVITTDKIETR